MAFIKNLLSFEKLRRYGLISCNDCMLRLLSRSLTKNADSHFLHIIAKNDQSLIYKLEVLGVQNCNTMKRTMAARTSPKSERFDSEYLQRKSPSEAKSRSSKPKSGREGKSRQAMLNKKTKISNKNTIKKFETTKTKFDSEADLHNIQISSEVQAATFVTPFIDLFSQSDNTPSKFPVSHSQDSDIVLPVVSKESNYTYNLPSYWTKCSKFPQASTASSPHALAVEFLQSDRHSLVTYPCLVKQPESNAPVVHLETFRQFHSSVSTLSTVQKLKTPSDFSKKELGKMMDNEHYKHSEQISTHSEVSEKDCCASNSESCEDFNTYTDNLVNTTANSGVELHKVPSISCSQSEEFDIKKFKRQLNKLPRKWEQTWYAEHRHKFTTSADYKEKEFEFSVMTYNILAQDLLEEHKYLYSCSNSQALYWQHRRERLIAEISFHSPDILNLQEVQFDHFQDFILPMLKKLGYMGVYQKRTGRKSDGCATLWKESMFKLLHFTPVSYCRGGLLDRDNIAIIVELQPQLKQKQEIWDNHQKADKLVIANTHLLFNPRRGDIKLAQLIVLLAEIDKSAFTPQQPPSPISQNNKSPHSYPWSGAQGHYCPVILTGDFNMEPYCELYKFLVSGHLHYDGLLIRLMSGQQDGYYGNNRTLGRQFLSPSLGITEQCQYYDQVKSRNKNSSTISLENHCHSSAMCEADGKDTNANEILSSSSSAPDDPSNSAETENAPSDKETKVFISGKLWHHLNLVSAYRHTIERLQHKEYEMTTHHNKGHCTVDYIFYSVANKDVRHQGNEIRLRNVKEGRLKLLSHYGLMSARELDKTGGIPNETLPSDHLCLITKFLLL